MQFLRTEASGGCGESSLPPQAHVVIAQSPPSRRASPGVAVGSEPAEREARDPFPVGLSRWGLRHVGQPHGLGLGLERAFNLPIGIPPRCWRASSRAVFGKPLGKRLTRSMQPGPDGPLWYAQNLRDLTVREPFHREQRQQVRMLDGQGRQGSAELVLQQFGFGRGGFRRRLRRLSPQLGSVAERDSGRNAIDPREQAGLPAKGIEPVVDGEEHFLRGVVRVARRADHAVTMRPDCRIELLPNRLKVALVVHSCSPSSASSARNCGRARARR